MTILDDIAAYKRREIAAAQERAPLALLEPLAQSAAPVRGFRAKLAAKRREGAFGLIAEIKKASPSKGLIRAQFDPPSLAQAYAKGGATCLSVLTDAPSFQGAPVHLAQAREATTLPVLRKDFILDPYQVVEARSWGADCILVIMACVDDATAEALLAAATEWNMDALVEVHDEAELDRALALDARMIGINNRDLNTFVTDLSVTERLIPKIPGDRIVVAESGLSTHDDLRRLAGRGVYTFLVGESLMRETDVEHATCRLLEGP